jgi:hypothetical protein
MVKNQMDKANTLKALMGPVNNDPFAYLRNSGARITGAGVIRRR